MNIPLLAKLPNYGDLMPLEEWLAGVRSNFFTDYDGHGYWATETGYDPDEQITPGYVHAGRNVPPKGATHVIWFNR